MNSREIDILDQVTDFLNGTSTVSKVRLQISSVFNAGDEEWAALNQLCDALDKRLQPLPICGGEGVVLSKDDQ